MDLADVIKNCKEGEVYKATYALWNNWYITKSVGFIRYCDENGNVSNEDETIKLTPSNLRAEYELIKG